MPRVLCTVHPFSFNVSTLHPPSSWRTSEECVYISSLKSLLIHRDILVDKKCYTYVGKCRRGATSAYYIDLAHYINLARVYAEQYGCTRSTCFVWTSDAPSPETGRGAQENLLQCRGPGNLVRKVMRTLTSCTGGHPRVRRPVIKQTVFSPSGSHIYVTTSTTYKVSSPDSVSIFASESPMLFDALVRRCGGPGSAWSREISTSPDVLGHRNRVAFNYPHVTWSGSQTTGYTVRKAMRMAAAG
ncbi:hypothetical protein C2E23DRAFT_357300 [Lenzites betulinus]|nr:hypothetical protein C2E23DRAFT_357300 [Lenzites betulinus]